MKISKGLLIGGGIALGLLVFVIYIVSAASSLKTQGVRLEGDLTAQYSADQNEYSNYATGLVEQLGVADAQKGAVIDVISAYVSGRKTEGGGKLATVVQEAVPGLGNTAIYDKIVDYIQSGRTKFKNRQDQLISNIRVYENWQNEGLIRPTIIRFLGFPSGRLRAQVGTQSVTGQAALEQMRVIITSAESQKAFQTGTDKPIVGGKK